MAAQEQAAGMLVTSTTAHNTDCAVNSIAQKAGMPSLNGADDDRALSALHAIPPDVPHDAWVRVLMAAKSSGLEYEDVDAWSAAGATYSAQGMRSTWQSIKPDGGVGVGTLFYIAAQHGWHDRINGAAPTKPKKATERPGKPLGTSAPRESPDDIWARCEPATHRYPYIVRKGADSVPLDDVRVLPADDPMRIAGERMAGALVVSCRRLDGSLSSLQFVPPTEVGARRKARGKSGKLNLPGHRLEGWHTVGTIAPAGSVYLFEGVGSAWSGWKATGAASICCFGSGRMLAVAEQVRQHYASATLVIVPDRGKEKECEAIARKVKALVATMPEGEAQNFDANDYAQREGHDMLAELLDCAQQAAPLSNEPLHGAGVVLTRGDSVKLEPVRWLWRYFLPEGMLTILSGAPGAGKSTMALEWAATVTRGGTWPDGTRCESPGDVIVWSGEDPPSVCAARLRAAGADMQRVHFVGDKHDGEPFDPGRDMLALEATASTLAGPRLLILDPIVSAVTGDSNKGAEVRRGLKPIVDLAQRLGCAVLGITHFSKGTAGHDPVERVTGSIAFAALARVVLGAVKVKPKPEDDAQNERRLLVRAKSNIGPDDGGFAYALERVDVSPEVEGQRVHWLEPLEGTARELLAEAEADPEGEADAGGKQSAVDAAADFLRQVLANGLTPTRTVEAEAAEAGVSMASIRRAADVLGIKKAKGRHAWYWSLPQGAQACSHKNVEHLEQVGHLEAKQVQQDNQDAQGEQDAQGVKAGGVEQVDPAPERQDEADGLRRGVEI